MDTIVEVFSVDLLRYQLRLEGRWLRRLSLDDCCELYCRCVVVMRRPSDEHPSGIREMGDRKPDHLGFDIVSVLSVVEEICLSAMWFVLFRHCCSVIALE